jgi:putative transposase
MVRHDGHVVSEATVLRLLRDEALILPAQYQRERRKLAERRAAASAKEPTGPNQVWQLDFSQFETTTGGTWRLAGCRDYWSKYEHPFHVSPTANQHDAIDAIEPAPHPNPSHTPGRTAHANAASAPLNYERLFIDWIDDALMLAKHAEEYRLEYDTIRPHEAIAWNRPRRCTRAWLTPRPDTSNRESSANSLTRDKERQGDGTVDVAEQPDRRGSVASRCARSWLAVATRVSTRSRRARTTCSSSC